MVQNYRIFVEKKPEYNLETKQFIRDNKTIIDTTSDPQILYVYDIFNSTQDEFEVLIEKILIDPVTDVLHLTMPENACNFAVEYIPGQYDQRADSAQLCLTLFSPKHQCEIRFGRLYTFQKTVPEDKISLLKKRLINPVEMQEKDLSLLKLPEQKEPLPVKCIDGFIEFSTDQLKTFFLDFGFSLDFDDLEFIHHYFVKEQRNPTVTELKVLDTYWSDHCRHTTFETQLEDIEFAPGTEEIKEAYELFLSIKSKNKRDSKPVSLMEMATTAARYFVGKGIKKDVVVSDEINACTIEFQAKYDEKSEPYYLLFKNETHNHPTEIEPFGGASTCLGGAIRDPLSGRAYVFQGMRISGAGNPLEDESETISGKLPQRHISKMAAEGFSSYGNQIGMATTLVKEFFHPGYKAKRLEVGFVAGAVPQSNVVRQKPKAGDIVIVLGGATGRDGVGGAAGSSKLQEAEKIASLSTEVQKGNPVEERKIQRLFRNPIVSKMILKSNDFGAGGVAVAIGEIAESLDITLDALPKKYQGLDGTELAISESQERMAVVVESKNRNAFISACKAENIVAVEVAKVTDSGYLTMSYKNQKIVSLKREFLDTNGCRKSQKVTIEPDNVYVDIYQNHKQNLPELLSRMENASQKGLQEMFDFSIGAGTVLAPLGGTLQLTENDASIQTIPVLGAKNIQSVSIASFGFTPHQMPNNEFRAAQWAVIESFVKAISSGLSHDAIHLSFQEYFPKLGNSPKKWGSPVKALLGAFQAQIKLKVAAIGGKDSMSGTFGNLEVPPTFISFACGVGEVTNCISSEIKNAGNILYFAELGNWNESPDYSQIIEICNIISAQQSIKNLVAAKYHQGGELQVTLTKMLMGNALGGNFHSISSTFATGIVVETKMEINSQYFSLLGKVKDSKIVEINDQKYKISDLINSYRSTFEDLFPTEITANNLVQKSYSDIQLNKVPLDIKIKKNHTTSVKPHVCIPVFPGTNCEYDTQLAFTSAGATTYMPLFRTMSGKALDESIEELVNSINNAQILAIPGGFSAGDEPDGSAKFIINLLHNSKIKDAIHNLIERDGLILGICNGFQALVKSGLLPYGEITERAENAPTLTQNAIGRHITNIVEVEVFPTHSPWLRNDNGNRYKIPLSHGEGRFMCTDELLEDLIRNKQIATQYVQNQGNSSKNNFSFPNASTFGIEGITDKTGRIFGRMGHPERYRKNLFQNIPDMEFHDIFTNGVEYFS